MQIEPLPPLNTLIAFECVARYGNISRAAEELNLTQSATSRQILQLEETLGCKLFQRTQRRVLLTPRGEAYAAQVRKQLAELSQATAEVMGWSGLPQVTIACTSAMASLWLSSRLSSLRLLLPELQIRMKISDSFADLRSSEFDLAIFYLREPPPGFHTSPLFDEICYPMCAPDYLPRIDVAQHAESLLQHTLLIQDDPQREWTGWRDWFAAQGVTGFYPRQTWRANNYPFLVQCAIQGDGILLGWEGMVQDYLSRGELVAAWPSKLAANGKCYLMTPQDRYTKPILRRVIDWLRPK
ncbi:LysR family transcriptional regulator [Affinibrenneria salicis]|uniref:LysR family transcriptional regulator n=1 Tax=Affinibrenneria salicis TaxID=2590031 RepID=A0A5J5FYY0_9GAMM|nr:LysR substrate-binding domain-containing protein [Affinibrenneria salicis]KAA8998998.1 LysR family transcriptional regulator [Affinibrenneria salicis]